MSRNFIAFLIAAVLLTLPAAAGAVSEDTVLLPILMYHHLDSIGDDGATVSVETFARHLEWLDSNGYDAVSLYNVIEYAANGTPLPDKPYCIVFDDGYESNLTLALPLLEKFGTPAAVCIIGSSVGCSTYKNTGISIIPHFDTDGARTLLSSGLISIGSHTWDMHMLREPEEGLVREFAVKLAAESDEDFTKAFLNDFYKMRDYMIEQLGISPLIFAYPHGVWDDMTESLLRELGVAVTLTGEAHANIIRRGDVDSLYLLGRFNVNEYTDIEDIFSNVFKNGRN